MVQEEAILLGGTGT